MTHQTPPQHSFQAPPDAIGGAEDPPQQLSSEPPGPTQEVRVVLHDAPVEEDQDTSLQALDVHAEIDNRDNHPAIDLGLWYKHACRPYLINFATKMPSDEVERITQNAEEHRNWIMDDLLRTGRLLFTLEFDQRRIIYEQEQLRIQKDGLRKKFLEYLHSKNLRKRSAFPQQKSRDDTGSVRSDGSGASLETTNSKSSQTSESAMNDVEQSYVQLLRTLEEVHRKLAPTSLIFGVVDLQTRNLETAVRRLEENLKVHQEDAQEIGFSKRG